jgi:ribonuclease P protein component
VLGSATGQSEALPRSARLRKRPEFLEVQARGKRVHAPHFVLLLGPNKGRQALGVTATRKVAGAVGRNRIKRLLKEVFRKNRALFPPSCAIVAVARAGADGLDYAAVAAEVASASAALFRAAGAQAAPAPPVLSPRASPRAAGSPSQRVDERAAHEPKSGSRASDRGASPSSSKKTQRP